MSDRDPTSTESGQKSADATATPKVTVDNTKNGEAKGVTAVAVTPAQNREETPQDNNSNCSEGVWMDVALTNQCSLEVRHTYKNNALLAVGQKDGYVPLEMQDFERGSNLEPACSYKFRVAAVNSMGVGPWSEVTAYRTLDPGLPTAPTTVKVVKTDNGATVSWGAPPNCPGTVTEFAVFLAVTGHGKTPSFQRVYQGSNGSCQVTKSQLQNAVVDTSGGKSAVIFRIAAKNERGFGPATQVRWLQGC